MSTLEEVFRKYGRAEGMADARRPNGEACSAEETVAEVIELAMREDADDPDEAQMIHPTLWRSSSGRWSPAKEA